MERLVDSNIRRRVEGKILTVYAKELVELFRSKWKIIESNEPMDLEDFEDDIREMLGNVAEEIALLPSCN